jgi:hypothetical protein
MNLRELKAEIDELCERDPQAAIALARRIHNKLQPGSPWPLTLLHRRLVNSTLRGLTDLGVIAEQLRKQGYSEEEIEAGLERYRKPGLHEGMGFGGLHIEDVCAYVEALWQQGAGRFTLEIEFENPEDDHLSLRIRELGRAWWQEQEEREEGQP